MALLEERNEKERLKLRRSYTGVDNRHGDGQSTPGPSNSSHEFDLSFHDDNSLESVDPAKLAPPIDLVNGTDLDGEGKLDLRTAFEKQRMQVKDQILELTKKRVPHKKRYNYKDRMDILTEDVANRLLVEKLQDNLLRSQASIVVSTSSAKMLVIKKEDKNFLNEYLKSCIDKVVLAEDFKDHDRPMKTFEDVQTAVAETRGWIQFKAKLENDYMKE